MTRLRRPHGDRVDGAGSFRNLTPLTLLLYPTGTPLAIVPGKCRFCAEQGKGEPNTRSVKTIEGNTETLRRYSIKTGKLGHEHSGEFKLSKTGSLRVLTLYAVGDSPENGLSYIDKVDKDNFYDVPGTLSVDRYARLLEAE